LSDKHYWNLVKLPDGSFRIEISGSGKVIEPTSDADMAKLKLSDWKDLPTQKWDMRARETGGWQITNKAFGKMLGLERRAYDDRNAVVLRSDGLDRANTWHIEGYPTPPTQ
jgi:hypothetical protein